MRHLLRDTDALGWFTGAPYFSYSGAVIVGAGGAYPAEETDDLIRLGFSTYGSRFDLQGWGEAVTTTGYGDLYAADGVNFFYTGGFSGTSSASPMVAAAIASAMGYWKAQGRSVGTLPPVDLRDFLVSTGTPQVDPGTGHIGPRPDLRKLFDILHTEWTGEPASDLGDNAALAWVDYDSDGDPDLHVLNGGSEPSRLLRNDGGVLLEVANVPDPQPGESWSAVAWADFDEDGDDDAFVVGAAATSTPSRLLRNDGMESFVDVTPSWLLVPGVDAAWADTDLDGDVDLYLAAGSGSRLARNDGNEEFTDVTAGPLSGNEHVIGASFADADGDGDPDLYLLSVQANALLRNDGGSFVDATSPPLDDPAETSGVAWGDYDGDGDLDVYLANNASAAGNKLLRNEGGGSFADVTTAALADTGSFPRSGYSPAWADYDNDGDLDLFLSNRSHRDRLYQNTGGGEFVDAAPALLQGTTGAGLNSRGTAWADLDGDGDLDLYVGRESSSALFRNDNTHGHSWIHIDLAGNASNRDGIGARIEVTAGGRTQVREISAGGGRHAQDSRRAEIGLGDATVIDRIVVRWPGGTVDSVSAPAPIPIDQAITWEEGTGPVATGVEVIATGSGLSFGLYPGAPNPFTDATRLRFDLARDAHVRLCVFDVAGRAVRTLLEGNLPPGAAHTVPWDGRNDSGDRVSAGVYFYRLEAGPLRASRHLVRLR